jgi:hypothetical protein
MLNASITNLHPRYLFLIRLACLLAGCTLKAWRSRARKEKAG